MTKEIRVLLKYGVFCTLLAYLTYQYRTLCKYFHPFGLRISLLHFTSNFNSMKM